MHATRVRLVVRGFGAVFVLAVGLTLGTVVATGAETPGDIKDTEPCGAEIVLAEVERSGVAWASSPGQPGAPY